MQNNPNRRNFLWAFLVIAAGVAMLLLAIDLLPPNVGDVLRRAWAIVLVIAGLNMLLVDRIRWGNWLALAFSGIILGGVVYFAYDVQASYERADYIEAVEPVVLGEHIQALNITVETLATRVIFRPTDDGARAVGARFVGSSESQVSISVQENEPGIVDFSVIERRPESIPNLAAVGWSNLEVYLPVGVTVTGLSYQSTESQKLPTTLDFRFIDAPRFRVEDTSGDVDLYMPENGVVIADVILGNGSLRIFVAPQTSLRVAGAPANTRIDENNYISLADGTIESRGGLREFQFNLQVAVRRGSLTIQPPG